MADGRVVIDTALNNKGFTRGVSGLKGELGGLVSVVKKLGAVIGVAFGVKVLVDFGKKAVELGSSVAEVQNVVDVAFGNMAYQMEAFAQTSIQSFGMSRLAAKKTGSTYMAMARGMGVNERAAADMAISLTGLSGDVASFFNISQELADVKLKSVFTGETETLKDLGVVMTQANLKAYALSRGISKDIEKMSQAELVGLRYEFVLDQLALAQGDFARTSDSWANQTRILSMQWEEFMSIMGQALITVFTPLVKVLNEMVASLVEAATAINQVMTALFGGEQAQGGLKENAEDTDAAIQGSVEGQDNLTDSIKKTEREQKKSLAAFDEINKLAGDKATAGADAPQDASKPEQGAATQQVEGLAERFKGLVESLRQGFEEIASFARQIWSVFAEGWAKHGQKVIDAAKDALTGILGLARAIGEAFAAVWTNGAGEQFVQGILNIGSGVLGFVGQLADQIKQVWDKMGKGLIEAFFYALNSILALIMSIGAAFAEAWNSGVGVEILQTIFSILTNIFELVGELANRMREAWEANGNGVAIWQSILNVVQQVLSFVDRVVQATLAWAQGLDLEPIVSGFRNLLSAIEPLVAVILDGLGWAYESVLLPLASWVIEDAAPAALGLLTAAIEALTPVIEALRPLATWLWEHFLKPIGQWTGEIIIQALQWITEKLIAFGNWARENPETIKRVAEIILGFLAGILAYQTVHKIMDVIGDIQNALESFAIQLIKFVWNLGLTNIQAALAVIAFGAIAMAIAGLVNCWDQLSGVQKVIAVLGALIAVAFAAALAVGAFQSAMSMGIAAAAIAAGVIAIAAVIASAQSKAQNMANSTPTPSLSGGALPRFANMGSNVLSGVPHLAQGAVIPANREFLAVLGDQRSGNNLELPENLLRQIVREETGGAGGGGQQSITIRFEGSLAQLARVLKPHIDVEGERKGAHLIKGGAF